MAKQTKREKSVLVTGVAGFIGSQFAAAFLRRYPRTRLIGLDNFATGRRDAVPAGVTLVEGSITDASLLAELFREHAPAYVFHFAALPRVSFSVEHPRETSETNVGGTVTLLEAASRAKVRRFIFSSSSSVYGGAGKLPTRERTSAPAPLSPYALQKYVGEQYCRLFSKLYGLDTVALRYFNVFGPGQYGDSAYATVISAWLHGVYLDPSRELFLEGDGTQTRDFCYVDSVVSANLLAMSAKREFGGEALNIAHGERISLRAVRRLIEREIGRPLTLSLRPSRVGDVKHTFADIGRARRLLGYRPALTFEEGLRRTVHWYASLALEHA